jgi:hypothetical protein
MFEDHRLRNAGRLGDLARRGSAKSVRGKKMHSRLQDLASPVAATHPLSVLAIE